MDLRAVAEMADLLPSNKASTFVECITLLAQLMKQKNAPMECDGASSVRAPTPAFSFGQSQTGQPPQSSQGFSFVAIVNTHVARTAP